MWFDIGTAFFQPFIGAAAAAAACRAAHVDSSCRVYMIILHPWRVIIQRVVPIRLAADAESLDCPNVKS